jgi:hypothetical protein
MRNVPEMRDAVDRLAPRCASGVWRKVTLVRIAIEGFEDLKGFDDVEVLLTAAFSAFGSDVSVQSNECSPVGINIVIGANAIDKMKIGERPDLLPNSIILNLEQVHRGSPWMTRLYLDLLRRFPVWDYSVRNIAVLRDEFNIDQVALLRIGYMDFMSNIRKRPVEDIDVLFYGKMSRRRERALAALARAGIRVEAVSNAYGEARASLISRAKVIVNIHFYDFPSIAEIVRLSYLFSNRKAVVSEIGATTAVEADIRECVVASDYDGLIEACVLLLEDTEARRSLGEKAFHIFSARDQVALLRSAMSGVAGFL